MQFALFIKRAKFQLYSKRYTFPHRKAIHDRDARIHQDPRERRHGVLLEHSCMLTQNADTPSLDWDWLRSSQIVATIWEPRTTPEIGVIGFVYSRSSEMNLKIIIFSVFA